MPFIDRAVNLLHKTESTLRSLVSAAATSGDYAGVVQITSWARAVSDIVKDEPGRPESAGEAADRQQKAGRLRRVSGARRVTGAQLQKPYPRFYRQGDRLARVAWSRREKKEYEHKTPYTVLKALGAKVVEKGADGRIFSTDQILPVNEDDGTEVPSYQVYVGIALLKHAGLIDQHGRQGYSIPRWREFETHIEAVWRSLPEE